MRRARNNAAGSTPTPFGGDGYSAWLTCRTRAAVGAGCLAVMMAGCAMQRDVHQFKPTPAVTVGAEELEPVAPPSVTELIEAAGDAFTMANAAQERGEHATAMRQYTLMLELLIEADLDPAIFFNLRNEFENILATTSQQAHLYERSRPPGWTAEAYRLGEMGDLEIEFPLHERIVTELDEIQNLYGRNFLAGLKRSGKYGPYIRTALTEAGLPQDLMWLAMVESQFTPKIISRAGAGGMWQFMRSTGRRYDLKIDSEVDERFDWQKCTHAAIAFLQDLYAMFESWPLAISAYNMGEGGLERAVAANGGERELWSLFDNPPAAYRFHRETKKFYPKLLATIIVANNPERYGFKTDPEQPEPCLAVPTKGPYSLAKLDGACGLPSGTLARLNPHLIRGVTPSYSYEVLVPTDARTKMLAALKKVSQVKYASSGGPGGYHVVRAGETVSHIAQRYHVSAREMMQINNIRSAHRLQIGTKLRIPGEAGGGIGGATVSAEGRRVYKIKRGDSLYEIAKAEKLRVADLQKWNHLGNRSRIYVGQSLYVSPPGEVVSAPTKPASVTKGTHVVRAGEYPAKIARRYGVGLDDFLKWNKLTKASTIQVGNKLVYYKNGPASPATDAKASTSGSTSAGQTTGGPPGTTKKIHKVAKGDNASTIADKYGVRTTDFLKWNGLSAKSILRVGDEYVVYVADEADKKPPAQQAAAPKTAPEPKPTPEAAQDAKKTVHVVAKGQNPSTIAQRYGVRLSDLFKWNGWPKAPVLHVGDKVIIYTKP